jgi:di/tricarboxylate transporter
VGAFVAALVASSLEVVPLPVAVLAASVVVFVTRCITPQQAYLEVDWRIVVLVASLLGFGRAMESTGTAGFLALQIVATAGDADPRWLLAGFFVLCVLLTQPMSNQAAAVVLLPVAFQAARQLELNPRTFAAMIAVAASTSYLTPLEPSCLMVYGPGGYRFRDFVVVGGPLTVLIFALSLVLVPIVWPL